MQAIGSYGAGLIDIEELGDIERCSLPGSGSCGKLIVLNCAHHKNYLMIAGGMFTANTMSSSVEALGMALPGRYCFLFVYSMMARFVFQFVPD